MIDSLIRDGETMPEMCDELVVRWGPEVLETDGERRVDAFGEEGTLVGATVKYIAGALAV